MSYRYLLYILVFGISVSKAQHVTTEPSWAPTGRLHQFNGFATPRPSLLPQNAQMVYASVWAAWSAWSFCSDAKRIRVRACNTVRGFRCLGPNQETEPCDSTRPAFATRPNTVSNDDYDVIDPWQEDRIEALKQLYPDESIDEKLRRLPENEKKRLLARIGDFAPSPPVLVSHELLTRPTNQNGGAPGATPERMFGARAFAVKNSQQPVKFPELVNNFDSFKDITDITDKNMESTNFELENPFPIDEPFETTTEIPVTTTTRTKYRGEGTFSKKIAAENPVEKDENMKNKFGMEKPKFHGKAFTDDIFGSIDDLMGPSKTTSNATPTTSPTTITPSSTPTTSPTTITPSSTPTTFTTTPSSTPITTTRATTTTVLPKSAEEEVEQVTPTMIRSQDEKIMMNVFGDEVQKLEKTTRKPFKFAIHYGEVTLPPTTVAPKELPEEISLDTLHALDWMLANMTKAADEASTGIANIGNDLRKRDKEAGEDEKLRDELKMIKKKKSRRSRKNKKTKAFSNDETSSINKKEERIVEELNDLQDLMEQLDERSESRSALMEPTNRT